MGGKRMRGFGLGMEDGRFGFYDGMGGPEFGYPPPGGYFPGPGGPPPPNINFNPAGEHRCEYSGRLRNSSFVSRNTEL